MGPKLLHLALDDVNMGSVNCFSANIFLPFLPGSTTSAAKLRTRLTFNQEGKSFPRAPIDFPLHLIGQNQVKCPCLDQSPVCSRRLYMDLGAATLTSLVRCRSPHSLQFSPLNDMVPLLISPVNSNARCLSCFSIVRKLRKLWLTFLLSRTHSC